jgi:hypothetical protein
MANMSYCMFENTYDDLKDCVMAIEAAMDEGISLKEFIREMSREELSSFQSIAAMCSRMIEAYSDMTGMQLNEDDNEVDLSDRCFED